MPSKLTRGARVVRTRFGVDDEICTGDHSCIRLSGCPSLTVKPNPDPLRTDPVATVIESCVGCGLCGEVAHAAVLCPSFYRADLVRNPTCRRALACTGCGALVIGRLAGRVRQRHDGLCHESRVTSASERPFSILIAALGGEGGGVLDQLDRRRRRKRSSFPVQSTSIPGVAQRTGATTYYIEILPALAARARPAAGRCCRSIPASATSTCWWRAS